MKLSVWGIYYHTNASGIYTDILDFRQVRFLVMFVFHRPLSLIILFENWKL